MHHELQRYFNLHTAALLAVPDMSFVGPITAANAAIAETAENAAS
jgi:hypothetical protein